MKWREREIEDLESKREEDTRERERRKEGRIKTFFVLLVDHNDDDEF